VSRFLSLNRLAVTSDASILENRSDKNLMRRCYLAHASVILNGVNCFAKRSRSTELKDPFHAFTEIDLQGSSHCAVDALRTP
jgi:hypothetical protein